MRIWTSLLLLFLPAFTHATELDDFKKACVQHQGEVIPEGQSCGIACTKIPIGCGFKKASDAGAMCTDGHVENVSKLCTSCTYPPRCGPAAGDFGPHQCHCGSYQKTIHFRVDQEPLTPERFEEDFKKVNLSQTRLLDVDQEIQLKPGETVRLKGTKLTITAHSFKNRYPLLDLDFRTEPFLLLRDDGQKCVSFAHASAGCQNHQLKVLKTEDAQVTVKLERVKNPCEEIPSDQVDRCFNSRDMCYKNLAFKFQDETHCESVRDSRLKPLCFDEVASYRQDPKICARMKPEAFPKRGYCRSTRGEKIPPPQSFATSPSLVKILEESVLKKNPNLEARTLTRICDCKRWCYGVETFLKGDFSLGKLTHYFDSKGKLICLHGDGKFKDQNTCSPKFEPLYDGQLPFGIEIEPES